MKKVLVYLKYAAGHLTLSIIFLIIQALTELLLPSMMSEMVDVGILGLNGQDSQMQYILTKGLQMLGMALLCVAAAIAVSYFATKSSAIISRRFNRYSAVYVSCFLRPLWRLAVLHLHCLKAHP